jgi:hypothetical protein
LTTTGGSGTGLTVDASESGSGYIDTVTIATPGHGYTNGDTITITSGGATAYFTISILPAKSWTFDGNGSLTFPDTTVQTTAFTGTIAYSNVTGTPLEFNTGTLVAHALTANSVLEVPNFITITSNGTITLSTVTSYNLINATNSGISGNIVFPTNPPDGTIVRITTVSNTNPNFNFTGGTFVPNSIPAFSYGSTYGYLYSASQSTWYRVQ